MFLAVAFHPTFESFLHLPPPVVALPSGIMRQDMRKSLNVSREVDAQRD